MAQELKAGYIDDFYCEFYESGMPMAYLKDEVDAVLAEKDAEIRGLKRALWLARAELAVAKQAYYDILSRGISSERGEMYDMWQEVERKCRAKAEEYK